jgi:methylenetetrahydrofolate dehydrogenase (NADP+)/methenyltetrahydrofolate cyclohydrolase
MILKGLPVAEKIYASLVKDIAFLKQENLTPTLAIILVGEDPASLTYVRAKEKRAQILEINFKLMHFSGIVPESKILALIDDLNKSQDVDGIVIQLPLPEGLDTDKILRKIHPDKDIDGFFSQRFTPPTAQAIGEILKFYEIDLKNKKIVVVGYGRLVGKPLAKFFQKQGIKPVICTSNSDVASETADADIIVSATGIPGLIKPEMVSAKAIMIDGGTAESRGKIRGDVDPRVYAKVAAYTPVPGGVGPVTVACLMRNLIAAAKEH